MQQCKGQGSGHTTTTVKENATLVQSLAQKGDKIWYVHCPLPNIVA